MTFNIVAKALLTLLLGYLLLLLLLFVFQRRLQYIPMGKVEHPSAYHLEGFSETFLTTQDSVRILAWFKRPKSGFPVILYFHGNAGNMGDRAYKFDALSRAGFGVLAISYRGYSGSQGVTSEAGLISDANAAFSFLLDAKFLPSDIILFGESLGSGIAVQMAAKFDFAAVILESPYSSVLSVAQGRYWFAPISLLLKDKFNSIEFAPRISAPVLVFHGTADRVVPYQEGKKLFDAITAPKKLITVEGAGHLDFGDEFLVEQITKFLREKGEKKKGRDGEGLLKN